MVIFVKVYIVFKKFSFILDIKNKKIVKDLKIKIKVIRTFLNICKFFFILLNILVIICLLRMGIYLVLWEIIVGERVFRMVSFLVISLFLLSYILDDIFLVLELNYK